jgi:NADH dehydrogenase
MILVAGGTGRLGTVVVGRLARLGLEVRVMTRDPARAAHLAPARVQVVTGDVRDAVDLRRATDGVDVVVSAVHGFAGPRGISPASVDRDGNAKLMDAAQAAGADFVLMSVVGASPDSPMELFRMKHAAERSSAERGLSTTVVRATAFVELWIELLKRTAARSGRPVVFGRGENRINFVSVTDVAALVERAVTDPATRGETLEIGGPDNLTLNELARAVQTATGGSGPIRHVPPPMLQLMARTVGRLKPELGRQARAALAMDRLDLTFDAAPVHRAYPDLPTASLLDVLGESVA